MLLKMHLLREFFVTFSALEGSKAEMDAIMLRKMRSVGEGLAALLTLKGFGVLPVHLLRMHHQCWFVIKHLQQAVPHLSLRAPQKHSTEQCICWLHSPQTE